MKQSDADFSLAQLRTRLFLLNPGLVGEYLQPTRFVRYNHIDWIAQQIANEVSKGGARIVLSVPPRHGKSWLVSKFTPVWYLTLNPDHNVILTSYEAGFAASWGRTVRNIMQENAVKLGVDISNDSHAADRWNTTEGGGMVTAGVGGPITGKGGDLIIIDDPVKNWEDAMSHTMRQRAIDWWQSTLYTRAEPNASIIVLMTRWHENDLAGWLLSPENENFKDWKEIRLPAAAEFNDPMGRAMDEPLCPERYGKEALASIKTSVGSQKWAALYQQRPSALEGNIIQRAWLKYYTSAPTHADEWIQSWDLTFTGKSTSDFVVGQCWCRVGSQKYLQIGRAHV